MLIHSLPTGGAFGTAEIAVSPVMAVHKATQQMIAVHRAIYEDCSAHIYSMKSLPFEV